MITTEKVFDILPDIIDMYEKIGLKDYNRKLATEYRKKYPDKPISDYQEEIGRDVIFYIIKNSKRAKNEFFKVISVLADVTEEEAKKQSLSQTLKIFNELLKDDELMDFFTTAMR